MHLIRALCVDISAQVVMRWLLRVCVALNRKVNSENQLNSLGITNVVAMTKALLTSLNAIYSVFKIPVDSALPDALTNESEASHQTWLDFSICRALIAKRRSFPCYDKKPASHRAYIIKIFATV